MVNKQTVKEAIKIFLNSVEKSQQVSSFHFNSSSEIEDTPQGKKPNGWVTVQISIRLKLGV